MKTLLKLGIYAGSFNPFHVGHLDIVMQAMRMFDKVIIAKGVNPEKTLDVQYPLPTKALFSPGKRIDCVTFDGLTTDLIKKYEREFDVTLIRGLRNGLDLEYEQNMVAFMKEMHPLIKIVAFYCNPKHRHVSSSALRSIQKFSQEEYQKYVV